MDASGLAVHYASADEPTLRNLAWLAQQWDLARIKARKHPDGALLAIDEVQKAASWPEVIELLRDDCMMVPAVSEVFFLHDRHRSTTDVRVWNL